jgi:hypothetical protein
MKFTVQVQAKILPTRTLSVLDLQASIQSFVGKLLEVEIEVTKTISDLEDAIDAVSGIDPTLILEDSIVHSKESSLPLDKALQISASGLQDGDTIQYSYVLRV